MNKNKTKHDFIEDPIEIEIAIEELNREYDIHNGLFSGKSAFYWRNKEVSKEQPKRIKLTRLSHHKLKTE